MERVNSVVSPKRDHLFISYASEDQIFARWLALRLTSIGYKVWFDRLKLLGGESWPRNIDEAIKTRTFRMLGLLSKSSINKPSPLKERTLALRIAAQPGREGFLIPLNVDGMLANDLDWHTSDLTFIQFFDSWATGLSQLQKLLEREGCPKSVVDGRALVSRIASKNELIVVGDDRISSNVYPFLQIPTRIFAFRVDPGMSETDFHDMQRDWACYWVSPHRLLAFHPPSVEFHSWFHIEAVQQYDWRTLDDLEGINPKNVVIRLLRACVETRLRRDGFSWSPIASGLTFPGPNGGIIKVQLPNGKKTTVQHSGERTFFRIGQSKTKYRYRLAVKLKVESDFFCEFGLIWRLRFQLTDEHDQPLPESQRNSRRKHVTRGWHNHEWAIRYSAAAQLCRDSEGNIRLGPAGESQVILSGNSVEFRTSLTINESELEIPEELTDDVPVADDFNDDPDSEECE